MESVFVHHEAGTYIFAYEVHVYTRARVDSELDGPRGNGTAESGVLAGGEQDRKDDNIQAFTEPHGCG